ncbi:MAG: AraC family transcriptional regulator [Agriterribacter sp.]
MHFFIKELYKPVQPTISASAKQVQYAEIFPSTALQPLIYCYWQLKTREPLSEVFFYRVVADGCIDIFFEAAQPSQSFVMGFSNSYTQFPLQNTFHYIGIRFLPAAFPQLFNIKAAELTNRFERLDMVLPSVAEFIKNRFESIISDNDVPKTLDEYFTQLFAEAQLNVDGRFYEALEIILKNHGTVNVETALNTGISSRQLRRLFEFYIGDTPKTFSKIVRFQNLLSGKPSAEALRKNKLFLDAGYYDQAHFIKEFKTLFGSTPSHALQNEIVGSPAFRGGTKRK